MNNETELAANCPFCGERPDHLDHGALGFASAPGKVWLCCPCGAMGPEGATQDEAIAAWNRRAALPTTGGEVVVTDDQVASAVRAFVSAVKSGADLMGAIHRAVEEALHATHRPEPAQPDSGKGE